MTKEASPTGGEGGGASVSSPRATIWKYSIPIQDEFDLMMPRRMQPLCIQMQDGSPHLWAKVDESTVKERKRFRVIGTGHPIPDWEVLSYVGTFQKAHLVLHLFQVVS